jgi:hypothetical protein
MSLFQYPDQQFPKRVHLLGKGRHEEGVAGGTITPGQLIELNSSGNYVVHSSSGGYAEKAFAIEDALQARTLDDDYAADERVSFVLAQPSDVVYAWLADGETVDSGTFLESNGNGDLKEHSSGAVVAVALEAVDLSASSNTTHGRLRIRVL